MKIDSGIKKPRPLSTGLLVSVLTWKQTERERESGSEPAGTADGGEKKAGFLTGQRKYN
jgi:hypothetical protein